MFCVIIKKLFKKGRDRRKEEKERQTEKKKMVGKKEMIGFVNFTLLGEKMPLIDLHSKSFFLQHHSACLVPLKLFFFIF